MISIFNLKLISLIKKKMDIIIATSLGFLSGVIIMDVFKFKSNTSIFWTGPIIGAGIGFIYGYTSKCLIQLILDNLFYSF